MGYQYRSKFTGQEIDQVITKILGGDADAIRDITKYVNIDKNLTHGSIVEAGYNELLKYNMFIYRKNGKVLVFRKESDSPTIDLEALYYENQKYYIVKFSVKDTLIIDISGYNIVDENALLAAQQEMYQMVQGWLALKQDKTDNTLQTTSKEIPGAINEIKKIVDGIEVITQPSIASNQFHGIWLNGQSYGINSTDLQINTALDWSATKADGITFEGAKYFFGPDLEYDVEGYADSGYYSYGDNENAGGGGTGGR